MTLDARLLEILACPTDKGPLLYFADEDSLYNPRLKKRYNIHEGNIPVMLPDEADDIDEPEQVLEAVFERPLRPLDVEEEVSRGGLRKRRETLTLGHGRE